jgi:hypothetical protein
MRLSAIVLGALAALAAAAPVPEEQPAQVTEEQPLAMSLHLMLFTN